MSRFFLEADSLDTAELRMLLVVHHRICKGDTPAGGHEQKQYGGAGLVRAMGPESWNFRSVPLTAAQALELAAVLGEPD